MFEKILNFVFFQITWLASVIGAAKGFPWIGPAFLACFMAWQLSLSHRPGRELLLVVSVATGGMLVDSAYVAGGILTYASAEPALLYAPVWILGMWANFALTLNHSLSWLRDRYLAGAVLGAIGAPLAYWGGARLGGMEFSGSITLALSVIGIAWALATPAMLRLLKSLQDWQVTPLSQPAE